MGYLFLGVFLLSFLAGIVGMVLNHPTDGRPGWVGSFLGTVGYKKMEDQQRLQAKAIFDVERNYRNNLHAQESFLKAAVEKGQYINHVAANLPQSPNIIKFNNALANFNQHNQFLIDQGNQIVRLREEIDSRQQGILNENIQQKMTEQEAFIEQSLQNTQAIRQQAQDFANQVKDFARDNVSPDNVDLTNKLQDMNAKSQDIIDATKLNEERIQDMKQQQEDLVQSSKERVNDIMQANKDRMIDAQQNVRDQKQSNADFMNDRLQHFRDIQGR